MKTSMRILLTERCNANCPNCFNSEYRENKEIPFSLIEPLSEYLYHSGIKYLKIMGGEPTIHSSFLPCMNVFQKYFERVTLFTNAISEIIYKVSMRENDCIVYNYRFIRSSADFKKLLLNEAGTRVLEIQVTPETNIENIINTLIKLDSYSHYAKEKVGVNLTLDCTRNILDHKILSSISEKWNLIFEYLKAMNWHYNIDHNIPICIIEGYSLFNESVKKCSVNCSGLIDSSLNVRFCNQNPMILLPLRINDEFIPFENIYAELSAEFERKCQSNGNKRCRDCKHFMKDCNGGCFIHKTF